MSIRQSLAYVLLLAFVSVSLRGTAQVPIPAPTSQPTAECYRGAGWLFFSPGVIYNPTGPAPLDTMRGWMKIVPSNTSQSQSGEAEILQGFDRLRYRALWKRDGNTLRIEQQTFPSPGWHLAKTADGLKGRVHFVDDLISRPPRSTDYPSQLTRVPCNELPDWPKPASRLD